MFHISRPAFPPSLGRRTQCSRPAAAALVLALVVSACSSVSGGEQAVEPAPAKSGEASTVQQIERVLFGYGEQPTQADLKLQQDENASFEERIAQCMAAAGFEYYPAAGDVTTYEADQPDFLSREYAAEYGFGYTTRMDDPAQWGNSDQPDANQQYVETLTPSEQNQYYVVLYGDQSVWEDINSEEERIALQEEQPELFEPSGCNADAASEQSKLTNAFWTDHQDEMNALFEDAVSHQLVQAPLKAWQVCMAEQGQPFTDPDDFDTVMDPYQTQLTESAVYSGSDLTEDEMAAMTEDELNALWSQPPQYDKELLAEAQAFEINLAVTSWDCGLPDLYDSYQAALSDLQGKFIESNLAELSALITQ